MNLEPYLRWFGIKFDSCSPSFSHLHSPQMQNQTETLGLGSRAPDFSLSAANQAGVFSLSGLLAKGPLILEFLRGTW